MTPVKLVYPLPADSPEVSETFKPFAERFAQSCKKFWPGYKYELVVVINKGKVNAELVELFFGLPVEFITYDGDGMDLGSQQLVAQSGDHFQVNLTSRMYAHREGWLKRLVEVRETYGPGLYGMTASYEGGKVHICTRGHCYDSKDFREYPTQITSRDQGVFFECGDGCLLEWYQSRKQPYGVVTWDAFWGDGKCYHCGEETAKKLGLYFHICTNRFRLGDQSNVLLHDRHTDLFRDADAVEKLRLGRLCIGEDNAPGMFPDELERLLREGKFQV